MLKGPELAQGETHTGNAAKCGAPAAFAETAGLL
jgi:hypothetical protein